MPTHGSGALSPEALEHQAAYHRARRQLAERRAQQRALRQLARERRADVAYALADSRQTAAERREAARRQLDAIRMDPAYDLYRRWRTRIDAGTLYDAAAWRRSGRLVPVTSAMRYQGGAKRPVVDWTDILDREAQERGVGVNDLPRHFQNLDRQMARARQLAREAEAARVEHRDLRKSLEAA